MKTDDFKQDFSSSAFKNADGGRRIVGHFCEITFFNDGEADIWLVKPDRSPIGTKKLNNLERALAEKITAKNAVYRRLDGEGFIQTFDRGLVLLAASLCGIKRKRQVSEATLKRLRENLEKARTSGREAA